ncbi:MAG TPA: hypothetical protein VLS93_01565 [Anaeromyxobacteraceae bacterium]|nr:hypothetical protein [Anaeromyxobacteraceae bacterium]
MRARTAAALASLPVLLAGCGGPLLFAEMEIPQACVTLPAFPFAGTNADPSTSRDVAYDLGGHFPALTNPNVEYELRVARLDTRLVSTDPVTDPGYDFGAVDSVRVVVYDPSGVLPEVEVATYVRNPVTPATTEIAAVGPMDADLAPYLQAGTMNLRAEYSGGLPRGDWTADVQGCFYLRILFDYGALLPL